MRQAIMTAPGKIQFKDVPEPKPGPGQVLLSIKQIGICGSDIHVNHGKHPFTSYPVIQGHEFSGLVKAVGKDVQNIKSGAKATARPQIVCGKCRPCLRGDYNICDVLKVAGFQAPGVAGDLFLTTPDKIVILPESMTFLQGALVEPVAVAVHATGRISDLRDKNVLVLGAGTIGNLVAQTARCRGAKNILITDLSDFRLDIAKKCGISNISNPVSELLEVALTRVFGEQGFDIAFEAVGAEETMTSAINNIQKGGSIVVIGVFEKKPRIDMSIVGDREISLIGTLMYKHEDYRKAVELTAKGKIVTEPLITKHFAFEQYSEAYKYIDERGDKTLKVMIDM